MVSVLINSFRIHTPTISSIESCSKCGPFCRSLHAAYEAKNVACEESRRPAAPCCKCARVERRVRQRDVGKQRKCADEVDKMKKRRERRLCARRENERRAGRKLRLELCIFAVVAHFAVSDLQQKTRTVEFECS